MDLSGNLNVLEKTKKKFFCSNEKKIIKIDKDGNKSM